MDHVLSAKEYFVLFLARMKRLGVLDKADAARLEGEDSVYTYY